MGKYVPSGVETEGAAVHQTRRRRIQAYSQNKMRTADVVLNGYKNATFFPPPEITVTLFKMKMLLCLVGSWGWAGRACVHAALTSRLPKQRHNPFTVFFVLHRLLHFVPVLNISVPCFVCVMLWLSIIIIIFFLNREWVSYPVERGCHEVAADRPHKFSEREEEIMCHFRFVLLCFLIISGRWRTAASQRVILMSSTFQNTVTR